MTKLEALAIVQKALTLPIEANGLSQPTYIPFTGKTERNAVGQKESHDREN